MNEAHSRDKGRNISGLLSRNKYLIITSVLLFVLAASAYLLFSPTKHNVKMELSISDDQESPGMAINEVRSNVAIGKVINSLGLQVSYYWKGTFTTTEIYGDSLPLKFMLGKGSAYDSPTDITINLINGNVCRIDQNNVLTDVPLYHPVKYAFLDYTIVKGPAFKPIQPPLTVKLTSSADLTKQFSESLNAKILGNNSFELSLKADNPQKGEDFLNKLIAVINAQYAKKNSPQKPAVVDTSLLTKINDSIYYYKAMADKFREQQAILNNIKKPRPLPKPKPKPMVVQVQTALTEKEKSSLTAISAIKSYTSKPNDPFVLIPEDYSLNDGRIEALIKDFNKAQLNKQRVQQDSDNADASVYAFKLEINSIKEALVNSVTQKEQKIRAAHQTKEVRQPEEVEQPKDIEPPKDTAQPKDSKSIASFISVQLNDSLAQINAIIKRKQQQCNRLLHGSDAQSSHPRFTIDEMSTTRESMSSKSLYVYLFALLAGLLLSALLLTIKEVTSAKKTTAM
ncbi:hypothetical protein [Mucilaginibacter rubeus]|uniref:Uncharacterized protein n=1 Tax=Mucilaginibacter rubeus TaxID=2027860 RepID=A0A5C1HW75_9SPHI|nr:hypothetical protein [Mucilaginibacter rubeus]QEM09719.1 hypothetical protein DEO27_006685 [Mucilaginibacter rubeus]